MIKKLLKEFAGKLDSVIGNKLDEMMEEEKSVEDEVEEFTEDTAELFFHFNISPRDVYGKTKIPQPGHPSYHWHFNKSIKPLFRAIDENFSVNENVWDIYGLWDTLDNILSSGNYTEAELAQKVAELLPLETNPLAAKGEIAAQPSLYDSVEENEDFEEDDEEEDESAEAKKDSVFVQLKKITDSFENVEDSKSKKPIIKNPLRHVVTDDGITVEVSYDDAMAIVDLMQADVKPESKQKMQELMQTAEGLESLIDYLSA